MIQTSTADAVDLIKSRLEPSPMKRNTPGNQAGLYIRLENPFPFPPVIEKLLDFLHRILGRPN